MNFVRALGRGIFLILLALSVTAWIWLATLQATLLNRDTVKRWLENSQVYDHVVATIIDLQQPEGEQTNELLSQAVLQQAINQTLTPSFVQQSAESALDSTYNWLDGSASTISFSIDLSAKRADLQQNLAALIEPQLKELPQCSSQLGSMANQPAQCLPPGQSAAAVADDLARRAVESSDFMTQPITPQSIGQTPPTTPQPIQLVGQNLPQLVIGLPVFVIVCGLFYVLLSNEKLRGLIVVSRRIFFGSLLTTTGGLGLWLFGGNFSMGNMFNAEIAQQLINPLLRQAIPEIGLWLLIFSGSATAVSGIIWLTTYLLTRKQQEAVKQHSQQHPHELPPVTPTTPPTA